MTRYFGLLAVLAGTAAYAGDPVAEACPATAPVVESCDHAINTKGTGTSGRCAASGDAEAAAADESISAERTELAIKTKGTSAKRTGMAIKTKGTGAQRTDMAIKTKGTGAQRTVEAQPIAIDCKVTSVK